MESFYQVSLHGGGLLCTTRLNSPSHVEWQNEKMAFMFGTRHIFPHNCYEMRGLWL